MDYQEYSDSELYSMVCEASEEAKEIIYTKYKYIIDVIIKKYVYTAKKLGVEYNDLYQEGLVGFADALNNYDESKKVLLSTFISVCVERRLQNAVLKAGRFKNKILRDSLSLDHEYGEQQIPLREMIRDEKSDPLFGISKAEDYEELIECIKNKLSSNEYEVYQLMLHGLNYQEIALILNKKPKQIDNTIQRLKYKIKLILDKEK
ncbi:MAG: sigma-70 family RNA polymerase sigma factor [Bacilli bacterium]|nr:sigma-70 family RNA polymerase sigma factor [Bacilli bacterium]